MRCFSCGVWSFKPLCKHCYTELSPRLQTHRLAKTPVLSFYVYEDIELLLKSKYTLIGSRLLPLLALRLKHLLEPLLATPLHALPIDDHIKRGYSHTAAIARALCAHSPCKVLYNRLRATKDITYAGQSLEFRKQNPKGFVFRGDPSLAYFLVDDVLTTGTTLCQAIQTLRGAGAKVAFALVLAKVQSLSF
ncbi:Amidophosphoribosyltransferase [Helicobacter sp. NHP19-003]|uniref:Amidophosphoribosyltransferase n=1 Tax=Helicobacter gastrocanis TaxID=2849641 RepID=A0ABN6I1R9_9HELI|nr:phosphoribosyltransferase family protein [Helicobacter sp. NHP19-003]BCZ16942.1 Amidophosphoribosyltransferase [Helicobacter sp. NHP19-003]